MIYNRLFIAFIISFLGCWGCGNSMGTDQNKNNEIHKYVISPVETNDAITKGTAAYYVFAPASSSAKDKLLIFLPGSLVKPKIYQKILRSGAENGVYSVGLSYQNNFTLTGQCEDEGADCEGNLSREELEGNDYSNKVDVSRASSIEGRIIALLSYLQTNHPDQHWDQFSDGGTIRWEKIIIAGHSQGSSHAAYIGWHRPVARVGMFSGPHNVANRNGEAQVSWLNDERQTPPAKFYGFGNAKDNVTAFGLQHGAWAVMDLKGPVVSVDAKEVPFKQSHQLYTSVGGNGLINGAHGSTCVDRQTPKNDQGAPVFKPVWTYMLFGQ